MLLRKVQSALRRGDQNAAAALLTCSQRTDAAAELWRVRTELLSGNEGAAYGRLSDAREKHPDAMPLALEAGRMALDAGDVAAARREFQHVLTKQSDNTLAASYAALCSWMLGEDDAARSFVARFGLSRNTSFMVRLALWMESEWLASGRFFAQRALTDLAPPVRGFMRTRRSSAIRAFYKKDYRSVYALLSPRLASAPNDSEAAFACAFSCEMLHDHEQALRILEPFGDDADLPEFLAATRARNLVRVGDYARALALLEPIVVPGPEDYGVHYYLAVLSLAHSDAAQAQILMQRAFTSFVVDTLDYQYWQMERALDLKR